MTDTKAIRSAVLTAGAMLATSLAVVVARQFGVIDHDLSTRMLTASFGIFLAFQGNAIPKTLTPLRADREREARAQACRRRAGRTWVLAGVAGPLGWSALRRPA